MNAGERKRGVGDGVQFGGWAVDEQKCLLGRGPCGSSRFGKESCADHFRFDVSVGGTAGCFVREVENEWVWSSEESQALPAGTSPLTPAHSEVGKLELELRLPAPPPRQ